MKVRRGNPVAIDDRLPDPFRPEMSALDAAILQRRVGKAGVRCGRALGHVPLEAVAEKNADLPAAVNRARFVQEVASDKIQAGNSKIRVIEGIQEFAAYQKLLPLRVVHRYPERTLNRKVIGLEAGRDKGVSANIPQATGGD